MPEATLESFKEFLGGASDLSDAPLEETLATALWKVKKDGVAVTHELFAVLQKCYAASILESTGKIQGSLVSKSVADVSETYNVTGATSFKGIYCELLRDVAGKKGFIV